MSLWNLINDLSFVFVNYNFKYSLFIIDELLLIFLYVNLFKNVLSIAGK
jgi:hypothetical protein